MEVWQATRETIGGLVHARTLYLQPKANKTKKKSRIQSRVQSRIESRGFSSWLSKKVTRIHACTVLLVPKSVAMRGSLDNVNQLQNPCVAVSGWLSKNHDENPY